MDPTLHEWLNLVLRWFHVVAGVTWIGQTYLFNWMEKTFEPPPEPKPNITGRLWMVHGGGFYLVEKQKAPEIMPSTLHWFKWEAALTWISGMLLLIVVYYLGGLIVEPEGPVGEAAGAAIGVGSLVLAWLLYRWVWRSPLGRSEPAGAAACFALILAAAWGLSRVLSPRAMFLHVGAMFGTIMVANVWMIILPGQRRMLEAVRAGRAPDMSHGARGKQASKHNTFMSVPLILLMVSNHFSIVGHAQGWLVLGGLVLLGWGGAWWMRRYG